MLELEQQQGPRSPAEGSSKTGGSLERLRKQLAEQTVTIDNLNHKVKDQQDEISKLMIQLAAASPDVSPVGSTVGFNFYVLKFYCHRSSV